MGIILALYISQKKPHFKIIGPICHIPSLFSSGME